MTGQRKRIKTKRGEPAAYFEKALANTPYPDECMLWPFSVHQDGYGTITLNGKTRGVHRQALIRTKERPDSYHNIACHTPIVCKHKHCFNPNHLRWGTQAENAYDRIIDGTTTSLLSKELAQDLLNKHRSYQEIAEEHGVTQASIRGLLERKTWPTLKRA